MKLGGLIWPDAAGCHYRVHRCDWSVKWTDRRNHFIIGPESNILELHTIFCDEKQHMWLTCARIRMYIYAYNQEAFPLLVIFCVKGMKHHERLLDDTFKQQSSRRKSIRWRKYDQKENYTYVRDGQQ